MACLILKWDIICVCFLSSSKQWWRLLQMAMAQEMSPSMLAMSSKCLEQSLCSATLVGFKASSIFMNLCTSNGSVFKCIYTSMIPCIHKANINNGIDPCEYICTTMISCTRKANKICRCSWLRRYTMVWLALVRLDLGTSPLVVWLFISNVLWYSHFIVHVASTCVTSSNVMSYHEACWRLAMMVELETSSMSLGIN